MKKSITYIFTTLLLLSGALTGTASADNQPLQMPSLAHDSTPSATPAAARVETPAASLNLEGLPSDTLWSRANAAYIKNNFQMAATLYNAILERGEHSAKLYFNLGNAYFKDNRLGKAIVNYNRALLLNPEDEDAAYNLSLANARTVDKIDSVPEFFIKRWLRAFGESLSSNSWAWIGIISLATGLGATILWLLSSHMWQRKLGFYFGTIALVCIIVSNYYAHYQRSRIINSREAVVMNLMAPVKSSPGEGSKDIFVLHEGTKISVGEELGGWSEITISDGNKGWILSSAIERIN